MRASPTDEEAEPSGNLLRKNKKESRLDSNRAPCSKCLAQLRRVTRRPPLYIFLSKDENTPFTNIIEGKAKARVKLQAKSRRALIIR